MGRWLALVDLGRSTSSVKRPGIHPLVYNRQAPLRSLPPTGVRAPWWSCGPGIACCPIAIPGVLFLDDHFCQFFGFENGLKTVIEKQTPFDNPPWKSAKVSMCLLGYQTVAKKKGGS